MGSSRRDCALAAALHRQLSDWIELPIDVGRKGTLSHLLNLFWGQNLQLEVWSAPDAFSILLSRYHSLDLVCILIIIFLAPPHDQLAQLIFIRLAENFRRENHQEVVRSIRVIIENFLTCNNQICNAHNDIQYGSKSCLHICLQYPSTTANPIMRAGLSTANSICESWIEHTMLMKAGGASWGNVYVHWCCDHWSVSVGRI